MPIYDYECAQCDKVMEIALTIARMDDVIVCKSCGSAMKRIITKTTTVSGVNLTKNLDDGFKDVLREVKKNSGADNTIDPDGGRLTTSRNIPKTETFFEGI